MKDIKEQEANFARAIGGLSDDAILLARKSNFIKNLKKKFRDRKNLKNKVSEQESAIVRVIGGLSDDAIIAARKADLLGKLKRKYRDMRTGKDKSKLAQTIIGIQKDIIKKQEELMSKK